MPTFSHVGLDDVQIPWRPICRAGMGGIQKCWQRMPKTNQTRRQSLAVWVLEEGVMHCVRVPGVERLVCDAYG